MFNHCRQFIRTVPVPPRDEIDMDDMDTAAEDEVGGWDLDFGTQGRRQVPQPLQASLSLRNKRHWNQD